MVSNQLDIAGIVNQQVHEALKEHLSKIDIKNLITKSLTIALEDAVSTLTNKAAEQILKENDLTFEIQNSISNKINEYLDYQTKLQVRSALTSIDVKEIVNANLYNTIKLHIDNFQFPDASISHKSINWKDYKLSGNTIDDGIITNFNSTGIQDRARDCRLTILDDMIVVENKLVATEVETKRLSVKNLSVDNLEINGKINSNSSLNDLVDKISQSVFERNIVDKDYRLGNNSILDGEKLIINSTTLGPSVLNSNLRKLGLLTELAVRGNALICETLAVMQNKIGINTEEPEGALTIWDNDAELSFMKISKNNMYIGPTRSGTMTLGTNKESHIELKKESITLNKAINFLGIKFNVIENIPDYYGEPNEIVLVKNSKKGQPFAYVCQGANVWASLGLVLS